MKYDQKITLAHGNGGQLMQELIKQRIVPAFGSDTELTDGAVLQVGEQEIVFSTDSFTIKPIEFPGGDIGKLAVCGTINDIAAMGATPLYLSCGAIVEEGFDLEIFDKILASMQRICKKEKVSIVTGDTKVVEKGAADGIYLNTAGIGIRKHIISPRFGTIHPGDEIVVSGTIGDHGAAIALARDDLGLGHSLESDCAPLGGLINAVLEAGIEVVFMRDPTRGGLATVLAELVDLFDVGIDLDEQSIPYNQGVKAVCEILGYDPLYLANEGKMVFVVDPRHSSKLIRILQEHKLGSNASLIGQVVGEHKRKVALKTSIGGSRILDRLVYDQLPRIC